jgi:hypothetical protein
MGGDKTAETQPVPIRAGMALIDGDLTIPPRAGDLVVFAHGSGSSRFSRRNRAVAQVLQDGSFATLLLDLLTREEESVDIHTDEYRFDIDRLGHWWWPRSTGPRESLPWPTARARPVSAVSIVGAAVTTVDFVPFTTTARGASASWSGVLRPTPRCRRPGESPGRPWPQSPHCG